MGYTRTYTGTPEEKDAAAIKDVEQYYDDMYPEIRERLGQLLHDCDNDLHIFRKRAIFALAVGGVEGLPAEALVRDIYKEYVGE